MILFDLRDSGGSGKNGLYINIIWKTEVLHIALYYDIGPGKYRQIP